MQLNDLEEKRVKNTIRRIATALRFLFNDKSDLYIGFYALLTASFLIKRYFEEDCESYQEFKNVKPCVLNSLLIVARGRKKPNLSQNTQKAEVLSWFVDVWRLIHTKRKTAQIEQKLTSWWTKSKSLTKIKR